MSRPLNQHSGTRGRFSPALDSAHEHECVNACPEIRHGCGASHRRVRVCVFVQMIAVVPSARTIPCLMIEVWLININISRKGTVVQFSAGCLSGKLASSV